MDYPRRGRGGGVSQTEPHICKLGQNAPSLGFGRLVDPDHPQPLCSTSPDERVAELEGCRQAGVIAQAGGRFINDVVGGQQADASVVELVILPARFSVKAIGAVQEREPSSRVDKDGLQPSAP